MILLPLLKHTQIWYPEKGRGGDEKSVSRKMYRMTTSYSGRWLVLTTSVVAFTLFKVFIKREYVEMEKFFGDQYRKYRSETPDLT